MKIAIRLSCLAAAALAAGSDAAENEPRAGVPKQGCAFDETAYWEGWYGDPFAYGSDPTGGAVFYETMGGDASAIASELGFEVTEVYGGLYVADPTATNGMFDAVTLASILNGADPYTGAEPEDFLRSPEGSGFAGGVLGSWYGRTQFVRQNAVRTINGRDARTSNWGEGVTVAVLDTGVDRTHALFNDPPARVLPGRDFVDLDDSADDERGEGAAHDGYGHGTTVAGLVLLAAPGVRILPVRVLDVDGAGTAGRIAAGIRYAADAGADVVNLSLGGEGWSSAIRDAVVDAMGRGVVIVAAAGNARRPGAPQYPAAEWGVIAATGSVGHHGDVWAPSVGLAGPYPGDRWFRGIGTSFSCALVSGGAAIAKERVPAISSYEIVAALAPGRSGVARLDLARLAHADLADAVTTFGLPADLFQ
jgi:subtilisin family serine protease